MSGAATWVRAHLNGHECFNAPNVGGQWRHWRKALQDSGAPSVHFHDLRHTGNTLTAHAGATLSDLMSRMGHASTRAARIYLHTTSARDRVVADALGALLESERTPDKGDMA